MMTALLIVIIVGALWAGWRLSQANTRITDLVATSDRDVAVNDEADMGEQR